MNGESNREYIVLFGDERYHPENFTKNRKIFNWLRDARKYSSDYTNAYIFRLHRGDDMNVTHVTELTRDCFLGRKNI